MSLKPMLHLRMVRTRVRDFYSAKPCPLIQFRSCSLTFRRRKSLRNKNYTTESPLRVIRRHRPATGPGLLYPRLCCKSQKLQGHEFFGEDVKHEAIDDSCKLSRVSEVACE